MGNDSAPGRPSADPVRGVGGDTPAASASHDAVLTQPRDRSVVETEPVGKHFGGVRQTPQAEPLPGRTGAPSAKGVVQRH